ncbi:uroporphyrinogen-III synthase [Streptomyces sp. CB02460]|uniref:uroporphyrinogen-III synthase n=1 Tax=Streptomyces sp. CB02460 TaxID=1703941 RepID=UPI0009404C7F|nr:uroporphyrinogen-III synthase [Streptomyces sp. CB02460]OKJ76652.1 bifunctional uroporphyrinogen-III synthetase/response regulator domain protein [Streptomyces sp. CB02460]
MHDGQHDDGQRGDAPHGPLAGFTVGVTAARRAEELGTLLRRRGATVVHAPALRIVPLADDGELLAATRQLVADKPDVVVATTAIGFRGWIEAADGWGIGDRLLETLRGGELLARGPKVKGAVRAAGLTEAWSPASESMAEVLERLLEEGVRGRRVALQLHGEPLPGFVEALREAGAEVVGVPVYRWMPPEDIAPLDRLLDLTAARALDALTFTSAPAAASLLGRAEERGLLTEVVTALRGDIVPACVGPVTAVPLQARGIDTVQPERFRLGPLVQLICRELPARARTLPIAGHRVEIRGHAVLVDEELRAVPPAGMALLHTLARRPGWVVSRADLLRALPGSGTDEHAVETAMARLRTALGVPRLIQTVVKRGYRLALDPAADAKYAGA